MTMAAAWVGSEAMDYINIDPFLDDTSQQMASPNLARHSRASFGQRPGGSMRIVKPKSTSNSPRSSIGLRRRRTVMDGWTRRSVALVGQGVGKPAGFISNEGFHPSAKSNRPVSWHPSSHLAAQQLFHSTPMVPTMNDFQPYEISQTSAAYSGYASPCSTFSPVSMPYTGYEQHTYPYSDLTTSYLAPQNYAPHQAVHVIPHLQNSLALTGSLDPSLGSHFDWSDSAATTFDNSSTAPPTPPNFLPIQHPEPAFPGEDSIPYHPLSDSDGEGDEVLVGMGLYDNPEVNKAATSDPFLDNYRALMMAQLLGPACIPTEPTERGRKGLKLEETWNPPTSDDEKDEDGDGEQDGEGEDDEEVVTGSNDLKRHGMVHVGDANSPPQISRFQNGDAATTSACVPYGMGTNFRPQHHNGNMWL